MDDFDKIELSALEMRIIMKALRDAKGDIEDQAAELHDRLVEEGNFGFDSDATATLVVQGAAS